MPLPLPNPLIYLGAIIRPTALKPHLRVPSISHVDWTQLRREGYNAVVIDKDNCLTYPHKDPLHPSISKGWADLKATFGPGNVLVVSNSAGTRSDVGGIAAESVSRALGVPVLLHARSKPGCAADIIDFFNGKTVVHSISGLGKRSWSSPYSEQTEMIEIELDDGTMEAAESERTLLGRRATLLPTTQHTQNGNPIATALPLTIPTLPPPIQFRRALDHPKIIAVGDRLNTDVLLARRLALHLRPTHLHASGDTPQPITPPVLSIVTTSLFKKSDVRVLRWMEESWLRLGLAMSRHRVPDSEADTIQILARNWVLAHSLDAPQQLSAQKGFLGMTKLTPVVPLAPKLPFRTRISNFRATIKSWVSLDAWKLWFLALIPTRSRIWSVCKSLVMRAGRGMVQGGRRLLPTR